MLSKTFIFSSLLYIVLIIGVSFWSDIKEIFSSEDDQVDQIVVVNETSTDVTNYFQSTETMTFTFDQEESNMRKQIEDADADVGIVLKEQNENLAAVVISNEPLSLVKQENINSLIETMAQFYAFAKVELSEEQQAYLLSVQPIITTEALSEDSSKSADEKYAGIFGSYAVGILIYIFVITYLSIITTDVASEKGSRALEMLLVSVKPETHFKAKVLSIFLVACTQFLLLLGVGGTVLAIKDDGKYLDLLMNYIGELSGSYIAFVGLFLLFTILMYLIIGALFGSLVSKVEESSQVMTPAMIIIIVAFYVMVSAMSNPDTLLIKIFSYIPFTSGMVMPMRIGGTDMGFIEPLIALVILILTVGFLYWISLTFYKRSVLTYSTGGIIQKIKTVLKVTT